MKVMSNDLFFFITGIISGGLLSWFIMKQRASVYRKETDKQISRFEKEAVLLKDKISSNEESINTLTASVSEKDADIRNLRIIVDEQKEDIERMNERLKNEFKNLARQMLEERNRMSRTDRVLENR